MKKPWNNWVRDTWIWDTYLAPTSYKSVGKLLRQITKFQPVTYVMDINTLLLQPQRKSQEFTRKKKKSPLYVQY